MNETKSIRDFMPDGVMPDEREENRYRVDLTKESREPEIVLERQDMKPGNASPVMCRMFTLGNFSVITGKGKSKKTFLTTLFSGLIISGKSQYGFKPDKSDSVIFDTEQGDYDAWKVGHRVKRLSGEISFNMFALRDMDHNERGEFIVKYIERHHPRFIVIDGIADLVYSINEEKEANRIQQMLLGLTKKYNCHILCIIHQNKADSFATGFLGSALIKKAEIVIAIEQDKKVKRMSKVSCEYVRGTVDFDDFFIEITPNGLPVILDVEDVIGTEETHKY